MSLPRSASVTGSGPCSAWPGGRGRAVAECVGVLGGEDGRLVQQARPPADRRVALRRDRHAFCLRGRDELVARASRRRVRVVAQDVLEEPAADGAGSRRDRLHGAAAVELFGEDRVVVATASVELVEAGQAALREQHGVEMGAVLEAEAQVVGVERVVGLAVLEAAVVAEQEHAVEQLGIVGHRDAGLAARHRLGALQAEATDVSPAADWAPQVRRAVGVRAVLDQRDAVAPGELREAIERRGVPPHVHDADGPRARGDAALDVGRVGGKRAPVDVAEDGRAPHCRIGAAEAKNVYEGTITSEPGADAGREVGAVQRRRAAVHGQCVARLGDLREPPFEVGDRAVSFGERGDVAHRVAGDHVDVACVHRAPPLVVGHRHRARSPVDREASVRLQRRSPPRGVTAGPRSRRALCRRSRDETARSAA